MAKRVLLICGSPHDEGCTRRALREIEGVLHEEGVETETFLLGKNPVYGCTGCLGCRGGKGCVLGDDAYQRLAEMVRRCDGLVIGSPVYFAGPNGALCALLDRIFYSMGADLKGKPACAVVNCRRGGASAAFDRLNKYITYTQGFVVTGTYWNSTHGRKPENVEQDLEGLQVMRVLGHNMATALRSEPPDGLREKRVMTDYIR